MSIEENKEAKDSIKDPVAVEKNSSFDLRLLWNLMMFGLELV